MIAQIQDINDKEFSLNGVKYLKNFIAVYFKKKVKIINAYDSRMELVSASYQDISVNGNTYQNASALSSVLSSLLFSKVVNNVDLPSYQTLALLNSQYSNPQEHNTGVVANDPDTTKNGTYTYYSGNWVKFYEDTSIAHKNQENIFTSLQRFNGGASLGYNGNLNAALGIKGGIGAYALAVSDSFGRNVLSLHVNNSGGFLTLYRLNNPSVVLNSSDGSLECYKIILNEAIENNNTKARSFVYNEVEKTVELAKNTTWQTLTIEDESLNVNATGDLKYKIVNNRLILHGTITPTSQTGGTTAIGFLPEGFAPDVDRKASIPSITKHSVLEITTSSGLISIANPELNVSHYIDFECTLKIND